ncbi:MAG: hypothetical protein COT43_01635 [Candidatus Marinimicrobia bacterium CG08_land_8_20_14_0_20_45_22]|nr:MAG: hypothetical protein COT43_01635 [Candidatus Marinimicrobia bacterium CG08_land_8_20_14_0_20_45_22]
MKILIIHGTNLPLIGKISAKNGTRLTLDKINTGLRRKAKELGVEIKIFQFADEARIVKTISRSRNEIQGVLVDPCALARTCFLLRELLAIVRIPTVEICPEEMPYSRESFDNSVLKDAVQARLIGPAISVYSEGLETLFRIIGSQH